MDSFRKIVLLLPLLCGGLAADEASDRAAITRAIAALNQMPRAATLFTADSDAGATIEELAKGKRERYRLLPSATAAQSGGPTVIISHEPMGEATLTFPVPGVEILNPRIEGGSIRFVGDDVALADATWTYRDGASSQTTPLLFVMKRDGTAWKIAALRVLAAAPTQ